jgi:hypothetical protein
MNNMIKKWVPNTTYLKDDIVLFGDKLYIAINETGGVLPSHKKELKNDFNVVDNSELVDQLLDEYKCNEDFPNKTVIMFNSEPIIFKKGGEETPIMFTEEESYNWRLI